MTDQHDDGAAAHASVSLIEMPPSTPAGIIRRLGPGLIIAASIVGSGELIATTKTGADAGYWLLWLILIGCLIKVFVQIEFGRFAVAEGRTTMQGIDMVPGPRLRVSWLVWYWLIMFALGIGQLGGIVGGVGQSLALAYPLTGDFVQNLKQEANAVGTPPEDRQAAAVAAKDAPPLVAYTKDDVIWATIVAVVTSLLLMIGRYGLVQNISTVLVVSFTLVTIFNVLALPYFSDARMTLADLGHGLSFRLPPGSGSGAFSPLATALATFGIIGVGASELIAYPYWCLEKGYARFTGPLEPTPEWAQRARGWLRVMHWDAWCSMIIYTFATMAFYVLGAAVLHPRGLSPEGNQMILVLASMYHDVFDPWGDYVFLLGAVAVLYSTFFVATAGNARMATDALGIFGVAARTDAAKHWWIVAFCGAFPLVSLGVYLVSKDPVRLVLVSGLAQSIMLPMLGGAALWFRYRRCDPRIAPRRLWDAFLWVSVAGLLLAGGWGAWQQIAKLGKLLLNALGWSAD
jgi:Mn2+/Fe2+ NRAMP family transporter